MSNTWLIYDEIRPESAGTYDWRVESKYIKDMIVQFPAKMRKRGAGFENVLSPEFDYWDGYRVIVPKDTMWKSHTDDSIVIVGTEAVIICPFCNHAPALIGTEISKYGGVTICASPYEYNSWSLECCEWNHTPRFFDPIKLISVRNKMLTNFRRGE